MKRSESLIETSEDQCGCGISFIWSLIYTFAGKTNMKALQFISSKGTLNDALSAKTSGVSSWEPLSTSRVTCIPLSEMISIYALLTSQAPPGWGGGGLTISPDIPSIVSSRFFNSLYLTFRSPEKGTSRGTMWKENYIFILVYLGYTLYKPESFSLATSKKHAVAKWQTTCAHTINRTANSKVTTYSFLSTYWHQGLRNKTCTYKYTVFQTIKCQLPWCSSRSMSSCWISPFTVSIFSRSSAVLQKEETFKFSKRMVGHTPRKLYTAPVYFSISFSIQSSFKLGVTLPSSIAASKLLRQRLWGGGVWKQS